MPSDDISSHELCSGHVHYRQDGLRQVRAVSGTIAARKFNNWYREVRDLLAAERGQPNCPSRHSRTTRY